MSPEMQRQIARKGGQASAKAQSRDRFGQFGGRRRGSRAGASARGSNSRRSSSRRASVLAA